MTLAAANYTWYAARAGGILALVLLTAAVIVGLLLSGRASIDGWPRFALEDVHRFLGLLTGSFIVLHVGVLVLDGYLPFSLTDVLVPGTAPYRPLAVAAGVVDAELLVVPHGTPAANLAYAAAGATTILDGEEAAGG